jgi:hypothetical protein
MIGCSFDTYGGEERRIRKSLSSYLQLLLFCVFLMQY